MNRWKNLKIAEKLKEINPKALWLNFAMLQGRHRRDYVDMLAEDEMKALSDGRQLEAMVRKQISNEFPNIENSSTYELLVDAVMHHIMKKQLRAMDEVQVK